MSATVTIRQDQVLVSLGEVRSAVNDKTAVLRIIGSLMTASIARTFRDQGSPAGSWPALAASTLKKKGYTSGHKLLILSGRLFNSITYWIADGILTIGTNVVYAAVHQYGSADRLGGSIGPQAKIDGREISISAYTANRTLPFRRYGLNLVADKNGKARRVRTRHQGPDNAKSVATKAHTRHQNIAARPYLVIRPEDPANFESGINAYLRGRSRGFIS